MTDLRKLVQVGQVVTLQAQENGLRLVTILGPEQPGCRVVEVGCDYFIAEDTVEDMRIRVPVHCIQTVTPPAETPTAELPTAQAA